MNVYGVIPVPPMPELRRALHELEQAADAIERARSARSQAGIEDAIRSARFFLQRASAALPKTEDRDDNSRN